MACTQVSWCNLRQNSGMFCLGNLPLMMIFKNFENFVSSLWRHSLDPCEYSFYESPFVTPVALEHFFQPINMNLSQNSAL